jgi:hypothetical protein
METTLGDLECLSLVILTYESRKNGSSRRCLVSVSFLLSFGHFFNSNYKLQIQLTHNAHHTLTTTHTNTMHKLDL